MVTIVILLILAGVTINTVFSDGGIIQKAQEAANSMNEAIQSDLEAINELSNELSNIMGDEEENPPEETLPSDGSYSESKGVNTPDLADGLLTPIVWDETANEGAGD